MSRAFAAPALWLTPKKAQRSRPLTWSVCAGSKRKLTVPKVYVMPQAHVGARP